MPRPVTWGTPDRTPHYMHPRPAYSLVLRALTLGLLLAVLFLVLQVTGVRRPLSPGDVISAHAPHEARCEECHAPRRGVANLRCQRCHDPAGAGRLTQGAHVFFGSRDLRKAAAAAGQSCAACHVEHRGRTIALSHVDETHCFQCHFRSFGVHPEFAVLKQKALETPGLQFSHARHIPEVAKQAQVPAAQACLRCHEPIPGGRDFDPVSFDRHCASCHAKSGSLGFVEPISQEDALSPEAILASGVREAWTQRVEEFEVSRGRISKTVVRHRDEWVLFNMQRLRRELDPEAFEGERGALLARASQLKRRLALSAPLAALDPPALRAREAVLMAEIRGLESRIHAQETAGDPAAGLSRIEEVMAAATAAGGAAATREAEELRKEAASLNGAGASTSPLPMEEFEARRRELISALEAIEAADPALRSRAEDLRRRLLALSPGDSGLDVLKRVRDQRLTDLDRVRDEIRLRDAGVQPPRAVLLVASQRAIQRTLDETQGQLAALAAVPAPSHALSAEERERKQESFEVLTTPCLKCHVLSQGALPRVAAARPVLVRSSFVHQPHLLQADCVRCHGGIEKSKSSQDLNFRGVGNCAECHKPRGVTTECQSCHNYHPPAVL